MHELKDKIEIIICTEGGYLESMSELLVTTLRGFGGSFSDIPIFSYQPRKRYKITKKTIAFFEENQVEYIDINLNKKYDYYPLVNKPLSCAHREYNTNADILMFLDSDIFFLNEPTEFIDFHDADVILRPVDVKNIGTESLEDENSIYWNELYKLLKVNVRRKVTTTVDNKDILEYYNSGHIVTKTNNKLFNSWKENFLKAMEAGIKPHSGLFYLEQSVFAATISQMELNVKHLNKNYNFPIHLLNRMGNRNYYISNFDKLVSLHYHKIFNNRKGVNPIKELLANSENGREINKLLYDFDIIRKKNISQILFKKLKNRINALMQ
jgi:hypothetical protein